MTTVKLQRAGLKLHEKYIYTAGTLEEPNTFMSKKFPVKPMHPERVCWGCDRYCAANSLICGNGSERTQHPAELFGDDWLEFGIDAQATRGVEAPALQAPVTAVSSAPSPSV